MNWQFEHFRTFYSYEVMQQAASILVQFNLESTEPSKNLRMSQLTKMLVEYTGHPSWTPNRSSGNLNLDLEGDSIFRNKARLLASLFICVPPDLVKEFGDKYNNQKVIVMTEFGNYLGRGYIKKEEYYDFIFSNFEYPNIAFSDYDEWLKSGFRIKPFKLILKILVRLCEQEGYIATYLTIDEICTYIVPCVEGNIDSCISDILESRKSNIIKEYTQDKRKITEMMTFMTMSDYIFLDSYTNSSCSLYRLNLIDLHPADKTYYFHTHTTAQAGAGRIQIKRSKMDRIKKILE